MRAYVDALALCRLLYASESEDGAPERLPSIAEAGRLLALAETQSRCEPDPREPTLAPSALRGS